MVAFRTSIHVRARFAALLLLFLISSTPTGAQTTVRISVGAAGLESAFGGGDFDMSADGRFVVFASGSRTLTAEQTPGLFRHDRLTSTTTLVVATVGIGATGAPVISDDGRFVAFLSGLGTLVPNDTNQTTDAFLWDANDRSIRRVSVVGTEQVGARAVSISPDGRFVQFQGLASGTYRFDRTTGQSTQLSFFVEEYVTPDGLYATQSVSAGAQQVGVRTLATGAFEFASTTSTGVRGNASSAPLGLSEDARYVLFSSFATNFSSGDSPSTLDVFIKDRQTGALHQVNVDNNGRRVDIITGFGGRLTMSGNGRWVVYTTRGRVVPEDTNGLDDVYLFDRDLGSSVRVSVPAAGGEAHGGNSAGGIPSEDGRSVAFVSTAQNLVPGDTNFNPDVFVHDRSGVQPCTATLSPTGLIVASHAGGSGTIAVSAAPSCGWTATANVSWIHVIGVASGTGNGSIAYSYEPHTELDTIRSGAIVVNTSALGLRQLAAGPRGPQGRVEAPAAQIVDNVTGAIPISGWVVDDVRVTSVRLYRNGVAGETSPEVFLGEAVRVPGARPDLEMMYWVPYNHDAGWGFMLLTNMLPNQGNGTFVISVYADNEIGQRVLLGTRILNCANAGASRPFGTIDTPAQGETVSGIVANFGWVLTPQPKFIPFDGSTIHVFIDGVDLGPVQQYNLFRGDIASLFPNYVNSNGALGVFVFDTRLYENGLHTIAWGVTDSAGAVTGIGSRFFTIQNP